MSSKRLRVALGIAFVVCLAATSIAVAAGRHHGDGPKGGHDKDFSAHLTGYGEVPSLNTAGQADLSISVGTNQLTFTLTYSGLSGPPTMAHVHVGQPGVNGGVSFFFCGVGSTKPACPSATSGTISGTVTSTDVIGPTAQGFAAGDLNAVIAAMRAGVTYANMHTALFPGGEIRGQVVHGHGHHGPGDH